MAQTILTAVATVQPASADALRRLLATLTERQEATPQPGDQTYDRLRSAVPVLHFLSITVASDDQYDPLLVIEANFDGPPPPFWAQLDAAIGTELRQMLRLCKPPRDQHAALFEAVVRPGSSTALAPLLQALSVQPAVRHQGNRGLDRRRIIDDGKLFTALQTEIDGSPALATLPAAQIHQRLRTALLPQFGWLASAAPARIPKAERLADVLRALLLVLALVLSAALLGWVLAQATRVLLSSGAVLPHRPVWRWLFYLGLGLVVALPLLAWRLRTLERSDASQDAPPQDAAALRAMARGEDFITQNHMVSIVHLKPGVLRMLLARTALRALGLLLRVSATNGYLASMRTIHFAHWAVLDNGGRLMFHSNYDGSWESYLDDFIEKAHVGLTLAWTHGVGFPPTRWLSQGGATEGRKFKAWARHSMSHSGFWFSAYKQYTVNQIERQARLAAGLRQASMREQEATRWAIDL